MVDYAEGAHARCCIKAPSRINDRPDGRQDMSVSAKQHSDEREAQRRAGAIAFSQFTRGHDLEAEAPPAVRGAAAFSCRSQSHMTISVHIAAQCGSHLGMGGGAVPA